MIGRCLALALRDGLGQVAVVGNKAGAGREVGADQVAAHGRPG